MQAAFYRARLSLCAAAEVQIKVQVFDNSDLSPLADAQVEVHGNQTILTSSRASSDGTVRVSFLYRTGTRVIITASKRDYVTNSVPWHSSRIPCKSLVAVNSSHICSGETFEKCEVDKPCLSFLLHF